jgi:ketosteroid isomerase-like protein
MNAKEILKQAETAYSAQDIDRIMELFDPEIVFYWNGQKQAEGLAEMREVHEERFSGEDGYKQFQVDKTLRAASDDTIAVEFETTWTYADGPRHEGHGSEFWMMRDDRLREWRAYYVEYVQDGEDEYLSPDHMPFTR